MASQLDKVFKAEPKSVYELFLSRGTVGFYIPAYQREYSWDESNLNRLFEDICQGVCTYTEHEDAITFIGTVICILDNDHQTIKPYIHGELPSEVMSVIDGQQRLTTLALMATCLYQSLSNIFHDLNVFEHDVKNFFENKINPTINSLRQIIELDRHTTDPIHRFYPKIIRAYIDQWASTPANAKYDSPVACYLFDFIKYCRTSDVLKPKGYFDYKVSKSVPEYNKSKYAKVKDNVKIIQKRLDQLFKKGGDEVYHFPEIDDILSSRTLQQRLIGQDIPFDLTEINSVESKRNVFLKCIRALIFSKFYLERVAVTSVVANNETYAFDMFEALNTTGEPLTAFETFKPKVIDAEDIVKYENSQSRTYINAIDNVLDRYKKAEEKHNATTRLLTPFRLAYEGESLSKHLSDQRRFLNKSFDSLNELNEKQSFVKSLYEMSIFLEDCWPEVKNEPPKLHTFEEFECDGVRIKLDMLRQANHNIVLGVLFRYFSKFINSERMLKDFYEFEDALKAIVSFFIFWRATRQGTDNIDSVYRDLLKNGVDDGQSTICKPLSINKCDSISDLPTVVELQKGFLHHLNRKIGVDVTRDIFVQMAKNIPTYKNNKSLTKYMLLISGKDAVADLLNEGCLVKGVTGCAQIYNFKQWGQLSTIEHVYPQVPTSEGWCPTLTEMSSSHVIGNLVLLPSYINSSLGNRPWKEKKLIFKILSSKTISDRNSLITQAQTNNVELSFKTEEIVINESLMQQVEAIAAVVNWDNNVVSKRSDNLYGRVWDEVSGWLGLS